MHMTRVRAIGVGSVLMLGMASTIGAVSASASGLTCAAQTSIIQAAPAVGSSATVTATGLGSYVVNRTATTTLAVSGTPVANSGWTASVPVPSGARVRVVFHSTTSSQLARYTSSLTSSGTKMVTHVVKCS